MYNFRVEVHQDTPASLQVLHSNNHNQMIQIKRNMVKNCVGYVIKHCAVSSV